MGKLSFCAFVVAFISIIASFLYNTKAPHIVLRNKPIEETHPSYIFNEVFSKADFQEMQNYAKNTTFKMTQKADATKESSFGSSPLSADGKCSHKYQHTSIKGDKCVVPTRIDVAKHLLQTGGYGAKKENYENLISRAKVFQHFWADFNPENPEIMPQILELFERSDYKKEAMKICQNKPYLDPMQASILVALPGQEIGVHFDNPWFFGADRTEYPTWLLVAMQQSGLYNDVAINQVQGVAYLHEWRDPKQGGGFFFYDQGVAGNMTLVNAIPNRGLIIDGTILAHGTETFRHDLKVPQLGKDKDYTINYNPSTNKWDVKEEITRELFGSFTTDEIRISLVWRQRCFDSEEQFLKFKDTNRSENQLTIDQILDNLLGNLMQKGVITEKPTKELDIIEILVDNYIKYPFPESDFPYNYCLLEKLVPALKPLLDQIC